MPQFQWVASGGGIGPDPAEAIAVDRSGNAYITGRFWETATFGSVFVISGPGIFVVKVDPDGKAVWGTGTSAASPSAGDGNGQAIAVDTEGNVYVAGYFFGALQFGATTLASSSVVGGGFVTKLDASGRFVWARQLPFVNGAALDSSNHFHVTGRFRGTAAFGRTNLTSRGGDDIFHAKYDPWGSMIWAGRAGGPGDDAGHAIACDAYGNTYLSGINQNAPGVDDVFVAKYDPDGNVLWAGSRTGASPQGKGIAVDKAGNVFLTGYLDDYTHGFVSKYDPSGGLLWTRDTGDSGNDVVADSLGGCYVTGSFSETATFGTTTLSSRGSSDVFVARYDPVGTLLWAKQAGGPGGEDFGNAVGVDPDGNAFVAGAFFESATFDTTTIAAIESFDAFLAKLPAITAVPPTITLQPTNQAVSAGASAVFGVIASGTTPLQYQWAFNGTNVSHATNSVLVISNAQATHQGSYRVLVSNSAGSATSEPAFLSITALVLTVKIEGQGTVAPYPDKPDYVMGEQVTLRATPQRWFAFSGWADGSTANPRLITIDLTNGYTAIFSPTTAVETLTFGNVSRTAPIGMPALFVNGELMVTLAVSHLEAAEVSIRTSFPNGSIFYTLDGGQPSFGASLYGGPFVLRRSAMLRAVAYDALFLSSWEADPLQVSIEPAFVVTVSTPGGGEVGVSPAATSYRSNALVTLHATPAPGWRLLQWLGDASGTNPTPTVRVTDRDLCAQALFGTTLTSTIAGSGTVMADPLSGLYPYGTVVRLTAIPQAGSYFGAWGNAILSTNNPLLFPVTNANPAVSCAFGPLSPGQDALTVLVNGRGRTITSPGGTRLPSGQSVRVTAIPGVGQEFIGWTGDASGAGTNLAITLMQSKVIIANFTKRPVLELEPCPGTWPNDGFHLTLRGEFGGRYRVEQSIELETWSLLERLTNTYGVWQPIEPLDLAEPTRFYRAVEIP